MSHPTQASEAVRFASGEDDPDFIYGAAETRWAIDDGAEADFAKVARSDFSEMAFPILVACYDDEQFQQFIFRNGLMCSEVRRFRSAKVVDRVYPPDKILLLLPGWDEDAATQKAADHWILEQDRYTCALSGPKPPSRKPRGGAGALGCFLAVAAVIWWLVVR